MKFAALIEYTPDKAEIAGRAFGFVTVRVAAADEEVAASHQC
jgi:hypothetical protein